MIRVYVLCGKRTVACMTHLDHFEAIAQVGYR